MNKSEHQKIIKLSLNCLSSKKNFVWQNSKHILLDFCMAPDTYAIPLLKGKNGPWRKYFPSHTVIKNTFHISSRDFRKLLPPVRFYIDQTVDALKKGNYKDTAKFAGAFSHYLADFAQPAHYYELDIPWLIPPPEHMANCNFHPMIENISSSIKSFSYKPELLGTSKSEFQFYLENKMASLHKKTIATLVPMISCIYKDKIIKARNILNSVMGEVIKIFSDFCYTSQAIASRKFPEKSLEKLKTCELWRVEPFRFDAEYNFGHRPLVNKITLAPKQQNEDFKLLKKNGTRLRSFTVKGICAIPHALPIKGTAPGSMIEFRLPAKTFRQFQTLVGLHASAKQQASCCFEVVTDSKCVYNSGTMSPNDLCKFVKIDIEKCKSLKLIVHTDGSTDKLAYPIWGNPILEK